MSDRTPVFTGGCQCGAVRYAIYGVVEAGICYCRMCQKAVGGPFFAWAMSPLRDFAWTRGQPATYRSSSVATRGFCPCCGTPLIFQYDSRADSIDVSIGSLDRSWDVAPTRALGSESRLPWCEGSRLDALPTHQTGTLNPPPELATIIDFQHPDHNTPPDWRPRTVSGGA